MVTVLALIGVAAVLFLAAVFATSDQPALADAPPDRADLPLPDGPVQPEDIAAVRFSLAPRGYRMAEVDEVLARLSTELADRDRRLALLEATLEGAPPPPVSLQGPELDVAEPLSPAQLSPELLSPGQLSPEQPSPASDLDAGPVHR